MTEYQEQVKNNIMYPNVSRNRNLINGFNGIPSKGVASILKDGGPRLQFQFNDINNIFNMMFNGMNGMHGMHNIPGMPRVNIFQNGRPSQFHTQFHFSNAIQ